MSGQVVRRAVAMAARSWPTPTYLLAGAGGRLTAGLDREPLPAEQLRTAFPGLRDADVRRVRRRHRASSWRSRTLGLVLMQERGAAFPVVHVAPSLPSGAEPMILVGIHVGAVAALGSVLQQLPQRVVVLHRMSWKMPTNAIGIHLEGPEASAAAFHRAVRLVRAGCSAYILADGHGIRVPFLGGQASLKRGAFALSRLTGVPLVPVLARWDRGQVQVRLGTPVHVGVSERVAAVAVAREFERYLTERPSEISAPLLAQVTRDRPAAPAG